MNQWIETNQCIRLALARWKQKKKSIESILNEPNIRWLGSGMKKKKDNEKEKEREREREREREEQGNSGIRS